MFCMPQCVRISTERQEPLCFPYLLTSAEGGRIYGYSLQFWDRISSDADILKEIEQQSPTLNTEAPGAPSAIQQSPVVISTPEKSSSSIFSSPISNNSKSVSQNTSSSSLPSSPLFTTTTTTTSSSFLGSSTTNYYAPKCISVISRYPFYNTFREFLIWIYRKIFHSKESTSLETLIIHYLNQIPIPPPSKLLRVKVSFGEKQLTLSRNPSTDVPLIDTPLQIVFDALALKNVMTIFRCLLLEEKVCFVSKSNALLGYVIDAFQAFMYPFRWPHVLVPVLPELLFDFVYSPTPYIMGLHSSLLSSLEAIKEEITIVNLETDEVTVPQEISGKYLPEPEASILFQELRTVTAPDVFQMDFPDFDPHSNRREKISPLLKNRMIQACFLRFFASLLRKYRSDSLYVRVSGKPVFMFSSAKFSSRRPERDKPFLETVMLSQAFSIFLEERTVPVPNVFDDIIHQKVYLFPLNRFVDHVFGPEKKEFSKKMEIVSVPDPKMPVAKPHEYKSFPTLNAKIVQSVVIPNFISLSSKGHRFEGLSKPPENFEKSEIYRKLKHSASRATETMASEQVSKMLQLLEKLMTSSSDQNDSEILVSELLEFFKFQTCRIRFAKFLVNQIPSSENSTLQMDQDDNKTEIEEEERKVEISSKLYENLVEIISAALKESVLSADFQTPKLLFSPLFVFFKLEQGADQYLYKGIKKHEVWQNFDFWENAFISDVSKNISSLYSGDIFQHLRSFYTLSPADQKSHFIKENDVIFKMLSRYAQNSVTLGTDAEIVRKFVGKMASFCGLPEEEAKLLLQLASNMNRVDEMESKTTTSMELPKVSQKSKRGLFVAVGIHSNFGFNRRGTSTSPPVTMRNVTTTTTTTNSSTNLQQEGMITTSGEGFEMLNSLIEETEQKIQKVKKTLRTKFKKEKRKQSQYPLITGVAEFRGDFGVKTFTGHSEGILAVLCSSQHVISGSCDGTIKLWDGLSGDTKATLSDHSSWVNVLAFVEEEEDHFNQSGFQGTSKNSKNSNSSSSSHLLYSGSYDRTIKLWDLVKGTKVFSMRGHTSCISNLKVKERNMMIAASYDGNLSLWDSRHRKSISFIIAHESPIITLDIDGKGSSGSTFASGARDRRVKIWDYRNLSKPLQIFEGHKDWVKSVKYLNKKTISSASADGSIKIWNLTSGQIEATLDEHSGSVNDLAWDATGQLLLSVSSDSTVKIWENTICKATLEGHSEEVTNCCMFQSRLLVTSSFDNTLKVWDLKKNSLSFNLTGHKQRISCLGIFENKIVSGSWDKTIKLWEFNL